MVKSKTDSKVSSNHEETFNTLQTRHAALRDRKISVETQKTSVDEQLAALQAAAEEQFGTHNIAELKAQLEKMEAENEKKLNDYQKKLNEIDAQLAKIDSDLKEDDESEAAAV